MQWAWLLFGRSGCSVTLGSGNMEVLSIRTPWGQLSWELGLLSGGGVMDATGIRQSYTQQPPSNGLPAVCPWYWLYLRIPFSCLLLYLEIVLCCDHVS